MPATQVMLLFISGILDTTQHKTELFKRVDQALYLF